MTILVNNATRSMIKAVRLRYGTAVVSVIHAVSLYGGVVHTTLDKRFRIFLDVFPIAFPPTYAQQIESKMLNYLEIKKYLLKV